MRPASKRIPESAEKTVRDIRRATRRHHSAEEKIRIVLEGLRGEDSIAELCRKEGINQNLYYRWSKEFLEAGKKRLAGDTAREASSDEVKELKAEARQLKETLAELLIENRLLKKAFSGMGRTLHEVFRIREVRDHRTGGTVVALNPPDTGSNRAVQPAWISLPCHAMRPHTHSAVALGCTAAGLLRPASAGGNPKIAAPRTHRDRGAQYWHSFLLP